MSTTMAKLYDERLNRYVTAMRNGKPDKIPIRPFVAEFTARYAGYTVQEITHDYNKAFDAVIRCATDFDWDAVVPNMVYVWTGLAQALGLRYYAIPGIDLPPDTGFQYLEPGEDNAFMKEDEYDALIDDPTAFLYNIWLPRVSADISPMGSETSYRNNLALVKGSMAMMQYFTAFGPQIERLRTEAGTVSAIAGILKAPFDILADKLRGYVGLTMDMVTQPDKVIAACEALMPHLYNVAVSTADPAGRVPVGFWMHRGCVPFVTPPQFESHVWPTLKPIVEALWANGHQTSTASLNCRMQVSFIMWTRPTSSRSIARLVTSSASAAVFPISSLVTAPRMRYAIAVGKSLMVLLETEATSSMPVPLCRTTPR